jgi:hypothetical protein
MLIFLTLKKLAEFSRGGLLGILFLELSHGLQIPLKVSDAND